MPIRSSSQLDLSLANIEIGEEELMVDPETPWFRKLWVRRLPCS